MDPAVTERSDRPSLLRLTRLQFWGIFAIGLTIFLFSTGPVWREPWRMDTLNLAILYSYLPLPFLVAGGLAFKKRLTWRAFFLDALEITLLKYSVTFSIALCLWSVAPTPPKEPLAAAGAPRAAHASSAAPTPAEPKPVPTPIAREQTGTLTGVVVDGGGAPLGGALVFIAGGLSRYVFEAPEAEVTLENDGSGFRPRVAAAMIRQPILARSTDRHLHTLLAVKDEVTLLNVPLLSDGERARVSFPEAYGVIELRCRVHQRPGDEAPAEEAATLGVFAHPFFTVTGPDGRFSWQGVPAGALRVAAWERARGEGAREVELSARGQAEVRVEVGGGAK